MGIRMEIEQNATILRIKTTPVASATLLASEPIAAGDSLLPETGFLTLLEGEKEIPAEPELGPDTISIAPAPRITDQAAQEPEAGTMKAPDSTAGSPLTPVLPAVVKPDDDTASERPKPELPIAAFIGFPATSAPFSASLAAPYSGMGLSSEKNPEPVAKHLQASIELPAKASIKAEIVQATAPDTVKANNITATAPAVTSLAAFFEPEKHKANDAALPSRSKELPQPPATRPPATTFQYTTPPLIPVAQNTGFSLFDAGAEPEFTITLRTERAALESSAALPSGSRTAPPVQAQIAAQFPTQIAKNSQQVIELRLDPPELGRVAIHITTQDQTVTAQILADRPDTLDLMRRHSDFLTSMLEKAGFSQSSLSFQQGSGQSQKNLAQFQPGRAESQPAEPTAHAEPIRHTDGRLDIRL